MKYKFIIYFVELQHWFLIKKEMKLYIALCFLCTFVEADVSDGFIRSGVTEEPDRLEWIDMQHHNHQELKTSGASRTELENLFNHGGRYQNDNKFEYFHLRPKQ
ncbi:MAG: hypothetical protein R2771_13055 [Saprospiraceae bacterium]